MKRQWDPYEVTELCRILNSVGIDTMDGEDGPLVDALMVWKHAPS